MMDPDRRQELIAWAEETLVPIREMAEGKPVDRAQLVAAARRMIDVLIEMGLMPSSQPEERMTDEEALVVATNLAGEVRDYGMRGGHITPSEN
jgi:hypothetical protein